MSVPILCLSFAVQLVATIGSETASIAKNLVGAGVLSLSGGIARYSNDPAAILSASIWVVLLGTMFGYFW